MVKGTATTSVGLVRAGLGLAWGWLGAVLGLAWGWLGAGLELAGAAAELESTRWG